MEKNIGLIGWFGNNALCDELIKRATIEGFERLKPEGVKFNYFPNFFRVGNTDEFIEKCKDIDLIVICGGTLLGAMEVAPYRTLLEWIDKIECPIIILGGAYRNNIVNTETDKRRATQALFEKSISSGVRGKTSLKRLRDISLVSKHVPIEVSGDTIFLLPTKVAHNKDYTKEQSLVVGIVPRDVPNPEMLLGNLDDIHNKIAKVIAALFFEEKATKIKFITTRPKKNNFGDDDIIAAHKIIKKLAEYNRKAKLHCEIIIPDDEYKIVEELEKCDILISMRLHTFCTAWIKGIPAQMIDFQFDKGIETAKTFGMEDFIIKGNEIKSETLYLNTMNLLVNKKDLVRKTHDDIGILRKKLEKIVKKGIEAMMNGKKD